MTFNDFDLSKNADGLLPVIVQDDTTLKVLMLGYMNREAFEKTVAEGVVTFWSRSRQCLWTKGETSGNFLTVVSIKLDCDQDTLLIRVHPAGPVCHTGTDTCWGEENTPVPASSSASRFTDEPRSESDSASPSNPLLFLSELQDFIEQRHREMPEGSYTTSLFRDGLNRMAQKVGEEALELVIEACNGTNERMIYEGSDMIYHLIVLLTSKGLRIEDLAKELQERHNPGWKKH
jgi:phosphoribosyl-ATP pyrophosphohydrolase/phosphoribosyl-AMP cyclohydrolase